MRRRLALVVGLGAAIATAPAHATGDNPQSRCGADWLPAYSFAAGDSRLQESGTAMTRDVIRLARGCRYGRLRITVFSAGDPDSLARARAENLRQSLIDAHWPEDRTAIEFRAAASAPSGNDLGKPFRADAVIAFDAPDQRWRFTPNLGLTCTVRGGNSDCKPTAVSAPRWILTPWPEIGIEMPMIFFDSDSERMNDKARVVTKEAASRFWRANCRVLRVDGFADAAEQNPEEISRRRVRAARDELIHLGVAPASIEVGAHGANDPLVPSPAGAEGRQNRRVAFDCLD
jgi:outer membrane protein OmpA-like peptidoglycan-associated protein